MRKARPDATVWRPGTRQFGWSVKKSGSRSGAKWSDGISPPTPWRIRSGEGRRSAPRPDAPEPGEGEERAAPRQLLAEAAEEVGAYRQEVGGPFVEAAAPEAAPRHHVDERAESARASPVEDGVHARADRQVGVREEADDERCEAREGDARRARAAVRERGEERERRRVDAHERVV